MALTRIGNVRSVVEDLDAAIAFFTEVGMELEGKAQIEGLREDRTVGGFPPAGGQRPRWWERPQRHRDDADPGRRPSARFL